MNAWFREDDFARSIVFILSYIYAFLFLIIILINELASFDLIIIEGLIFFKIILFYFMYGFAFKSIYYMKYRDSDLFLKAALNNFSNSLFLYLSKRYL